MGDRLPWATRMVLAAADGALAWGWSIAIGLSLSALAIERSLKHPRARLRIDAWVLQAPLIGGLVARMETARFTYNLGTLLASGITVPEGLRLSRDALANRAMAQAVDKVSQEIRRGGRLAEPLAASGSFPKLAVQMIAVGEESGSLDRSLLKVAEVYEREIAEETRRILTVLEPVLIVGLGAVIAGIILSILVGIVSVNDLPI
jgi:general secretion pathway protein F